MTAEALLVGDTRHHGWIGPVPSRAERIATYFVGIAGVMFAGVGPLLLGGLEGFGRLTAAQLGQAGTAELLAMGVAAALAGPLLGIRHLRWVAVVCGLAMALLNEATARVSGDALILVRGLIGVPSGVLIWLVTGMIVRSPRPERGAGIYMTTQTLAQLVMVAAISALVLARWGVDGGFRCLAGLGLATAIAGFLVPARYAAIAEEADSTAEKHLPPFRGWVALAAVLLFQAFILAMWIYVEPLSRQSGHAPAVAGTAISLSLAAQVAGGTVATLIAGRIAWVWALFAAIIVMIAALGVFAVLPAAPLFLLASAVFGFAWIFAAPFFTPLAIEADPSRGAALLGPAASLLGCSLGPFLGSLVVSDGDVRGSLGMAAALAVGCIAIVAGLHFTRRSA